MSDKFISLDSLKEYNKQMKETYIEPLNEKIETIPQVDWDQDNPNEMSYIINKPCGISYEIVKPEFSTYNPSGEPFVEKFQVLCNNASLLKNNYFSVTASIYVDYPMLGDNSHITTKSYNSTENNITIEDVEDDKAIITIFDQMIGDYAHSFYAVEDIFIRVKHIKTLDDNFLSSNIVRTTDLDNALSSKLDKATNKTTYDSVYVKTADGTRQLMYPIMFPHYTGNIGNRTGLIYMTNGQILCNTPDHEFHAANRGYVDELAERQQKEIEGKVATVTFNTTEASTEINLQNLEGMTQIDWGDGTINSELSHTYANIGKYECKIYDITSIGQAAFSGCNSLISIKIPDSVESISGWAFSGCSSLASVEIGNNVKSIGDSAFTDCVGLTSVVLGNSVEIIDADAFSYCKNLTSIVIPNSVTSIGYSAFSVCSSLIEIVIPDSVMSIGYSAFTHCSSLTSVVFKNPTPIYYYIERDIHWFNECTALTCIYVPYSCKQAYIDKWAADGATQEILDKIVEVKSDRKAMMSDVTSKCLTEVHTITNSTVYELPKGRSAIIFTGGEVTLTTYYKGGGSATTEVGDNVCLIGLDKDGKWSFGVSIKEGTLSIPDVQAEQRQDVDKIEITTTGTNNVFLL